VLAAAAHTWLAASVFVQSVQSGAALRSAGLSQNEVCRWPGGQAPATGAQTTQSCRMLS
jgi:hypothetical protein